ncbi:MAG: OmpA family protein [Bacteroidales bacterium]|nr:OmpA family protein [Bacteroidales bacterium]
MKKTIVLLLCLSCFQLYAQKPKADKKFILYEYNEAIPLYLEYLQKHPGDYEASKRLALSYKYTNNIIASINLYKSIVNLPESISQDLYDLAQLLRIQGDIAEAEKYAIIFKRLDNGEKAENLLTAIKMYDELILNKDKYLITNKTKPYNQSVFASAPYKNGFIVTRENINQKKSSWTGKGFTKLFYSDIDFLNFAPFATEVMSEYDDGIATFTVDNNTMYYTSVNKLSLKESEVNTRKLQISCAEFHNTSWQLTDRFLFNNSAYNTAHPCLDKSGKLLVFSSDMPGGRGGMDLYYCTLNLDNTWSKPIIISSLNSIENEVFPIFDADGNLYFSSNGLPGLGGLDIFFSEFKNGEFVAPVNVKAPINSSYDDFFLVTFDHMESGYISTNRFDSPETDDIAHFSRKIEISEKPITKVVIKINVIDKYTSTPLPYVSVSLKDSQNNVIHTGMTDPHGVLMIEEIPQNDYTVQGILNDITTTIANVSKDEFSQPLIEKILKHNDPRFTLAGLVVNSINEQPIPGVSVTCHNITINRVKQITTSNDGKFFFQLEQQSDFKVSGEKSGWLSSEAAYESTKGLDRSKELYVTLKLNMQQPTGTAVIKLDKIYYAYDKCNINSRAAEELNRLVKLMYDFPDMIIELSSHTDCRGSNAYNEKLSQCRADAAVEYILSKGIKSEKIKAKGYGEEKLVNNCGDGIECTEKQHQENRRTEFKIIQCPSCPEIEK